MEGTHNCILSLPLHHGCLKDGCSCRKLLLLVFTILSIISNVGGVGTTTASSNITEVRLVNSPRTETEYGYEVHEYAGIIQIYDKIEKQWGPMCGRDIGPEEAEVICKQLGYSDGYDKYYSDGQDKYGSLDNPYNGYVFVGLSCEGTETNIEECSYEDRRGTSGQCGNKNQEYGAVRCNDGESDGFKFEYLLFIAVGIAFISMVAFVRRNCRNCCDRGFSSTTTRTNDQALENNVTSSPPPPAPSHGNYQQVPDADLPPQYDKCVPSADGQGPNPYPPPGTAPYPPQDGAPYLPPQGGVAPGAPQGGGTPYPAAPPSTNPAYPPSGDPAFPPADYTPNDEPPASPPPSYDAL
ncbi:uncharacterized protein [Amphiura filiformis]|uniref:uncharacterized protein n=1 Tax=Amphiura filiformis TaxID=82378 RepID=UPI003B20E42B